MCKGLHADAEQSVGPGLNDVSHEPLNCFDVMYTALPVLDAHDFDLVIYFVHC